MLVHHITIKSMNISNKIFENKITMFQMNVLKTKAQCLNKYFENKGGITNKIMNDFIQEILNNIGL